METADFVLQVKRQYGDEYGVVITDPDILQYIYEGEMDILRASGGFETKNLTAAVSTFPIKVPEAIQIIRLVVNNATLSYISLNELDLLRISLNTTEGAPAYWYDPAHELGDIDLYPKTPNDTSVVTIYYRHTAIKRSSVTGDLTVHERHHTDLLQFCLAKCHNKNRDAQSEQIAMAYYDKNISMRREENESYDGPIYRQPDPEDFSWQ